VFIPTNKEQLAEVLTKRNQEQTPSEPAKEALNLGAIVRDHQRASLDAPRKLLAKTSAQRSVNSEVVEDDSDELTELSPILGRRQKTGNGYTMQTPGTPLRKEEEVNIFGPLATLENYLLQAVGLPSNEVQKLRRQMVRTLIATKKGRGALFMIS